MLRSMTGFGAASGASLGWALRVEIRSVNHRHLQIKTRLPGKWMALENAVEVRLRRHLHRGSVTVTVLAQGDPNAAVGEVRIDVARAYMQQIDELASSLGIDGKPSLDALLALPGVVGTAAGAEEGPHDGLGNREETLLKGLVDEAVKRLLEMRDAEGAALDGDLRRNMARLTEFSAKIERRMPTVVRGHQRDLKKRVAALMAPADRLEPGDLAREVALLADRFDVAEELVRLASHLAQIEKVLGTSGAVGRKLEFVVQEVLREVNTIGSKCNDARVTGWVVDMKACVERVREQVQNVE